MGEMKWVAQNLFCAKKIKIVTMRKCFHRQGLITDWAERWVEWLGVGFIL